MRESFGTAETGRRTVFTARQPFEWRILPKDQRRALALKRAPVFVSGLCGALVLGGGAVAQQTVSSSSTVGEVVVTGSRFTTRNATSAAPVTVVGAAEVLRQGATKIEDVLNTLPQVNAGLTDSGVGISQTPLTGTAVVDLRGIGAFRTLVLMNGRRVNPGDAVNPSADLHTIPEILIKRVEVLTGGASAIYGSDAEAGVVNFVMDTDYTGVKLVAQGSAYVGANNDRATQQVVRASGYQPATGTVFDGQTYNITAVAGGPFAGGRGHVEIYGGIRQSAGILASSRDFSGCTLTESGPSYACLLDGTTAAGQVVDPAGNAYSLSGSSLRPYNNATDGYNFTPPESLQRPDMRYTAGIFAHYTFNEHVQAYLEGQYMHDRTSLQYEPSGTAQTGVGPQTYAVPCGDPLLSTDQFNALCAANGLATSDVAQIGVGRRNIEGGPLHDTFRHTSYRVVVGLKGAITDNWTYDANLNYGRVTSDENVSNDISASKVANALDVVSVGGAPTCQSVVDGSDPACVPYNIWSAGSVTPAALHYITEGGGNAGSASQTVISAQVVGALGGYGLKSPWASDGFGLAFGGEYRNESITNQPSATMAAGDLVYASNVLYGSLPTRGSFHVVEGFAELKAPLLENVPFAAALNLDIADRFAHYTPQGSANAYNLGVDWAPIQQTRFRFSYSHSIRAANGHELFLAQSAGLQQTADPCSGPAPAASQADCARTGLDASKYGRLQTANSVNVISGGNPNLKPETANTVTAGVVFSHFGFAPNLTISIDYWKIRIDKYIGSIPASTSLGECLASGSPVFCSLIQRDSSGSLTSGDILASRANTGSYGQSGIDFAGQYSFEVDPRDRLSFSFDGSLAIDNPIAVNPSAPLADCTGLFGASCSGEGPTSPIPSWRHDLRTTWTRGNMEASLNWRFIAPLNFEGTSQYFAGETVYPIDSHVQAFTYFDLNLGYNFKKVEVHLGVNNIFGRRAPVIGYGSNPLLMNGNLLAGMYDSFGREVFLELSAHM